MKCRIKKTGEIINIAEYADVELDKCNDYGDPIRLGFDEVEFIQEKSSDIDWEQRRFEIAKSVLPSLCDNETPIIKIVEMSTLIADTLIKELKGEK